MPDNAAASTSQCAFCHIVSAGAPGENVFNDDVSLAFLDVRPLFPGHCLLIPKQHYETLSDLPAALVPQLFLNAQRLSRAVEKALDAEGTFVAINNRVSQSVPHLHIHIVPRRRKDGLKGFFWPRNPYRDEQQASDIRQAIRQALTSDQGAS